MLVTFEVSTVIMVHVMKLPNRTLKNILIKRTYNISHGFLKWLYTVQKKLSFPLKISSVNVTKSRESWGFGHIYRKNT